MLSTVTRRPALVKPEVMHYVIFSLLCLIWGASFLLMKKAALSFGPVTIAGLRCASGALAVGVVWVALRRLERVERSLWLWIGVATALGYAIPYSVQPYLVARYGSGFIGMMIAFVPLLTILVSMPVLRVFPTRWQVVGVLGGLVGMGVVMLDGIRRRVPVAHLLLAMVVPLCYASANIVIKRHLGRVSPVMLSLVCMSLASLILVPGGGVMETVKFGPSFHLSVVCLLILGLLGTGLATVIFFRLIRDQGPLFAGMVTYIVPLGAVGWGWLDAERVTGLQLLALCAVLAMVAVVQRDVIKQQTGQAG